MLINPEHSERIRGTEYWLFCQIKLHSHNNYAVLYGEGIVSLNLVILAKSIWEPAYAHPLLMVCLPRCRPTSCVLHTHARPPYSRRHRSHTAHKRIYDELARWTFTDNSRVSNYRSFWIVSTLQSSTLP